jgi:hypothetical protein
VRKAKSKVTDHDTPTVPPPGPLPSTLPEELQHNPAETYAIGKALEGLSEVDRYLRGRCDGELAAAVAKLGADERKARADFEARIEGKIDQLISMHAKQSDDVLAYVQQVVAVDFKQRAHEHGNEHCENQACEFRRLSNSVKDEAKEA